MDIAALLEPYISGPTSTQIAQVSTYLDLLLRWNAKTNLTSIRDPQQIVTRHFGESFFLARQLFGLEGFKLQITNYKLQILDLGSGAGFPGIPLKIACPDITLTLVEAHHTKAVFLREVLRALQLDGEVKGVRAEQLPPASASLVTLRAVEKFESILPIAARLVKGSQDKPVWEQAPPPVQATRSVAALPPQPNPSSPAGASSHSPTRQSRVSDPSSSPSPFRDDIHPPCTPHGLAFLISSAQIAAARKILPNWRFHPEIPIPKSQNRVIQLVEPNQ